MASGWQGHNVRCGTVGHLIADHVNAAPTGNGNDAGLAAKVDPRAGHGGRTAAATAAASSAR